jgi:cob(I)alamin adenosyltransferase
MVYLHRIYTKSGDDGTTGLGDGSRVPKTHPRIAAYGGVDELNAVLGLALTAGLPGEAADWLRQVQNDLFDLGADLCVPQKRDEGEGREAGDDPDSPPAPPPSPSTVLRVAPAQVERLEGWIDRVNESLEPLTSFVLPGGSVAAAHLHHARTVCRRVEIGVITLASQEPVNSQVPVYLNRLSDLLFVLARHANDSGRGDVLWRPGAGRDFTAP